MGKKGKAKISKVKRNNQTTNKMKKQGTMKLQRHRTKVQKQRPPSTPQREYSDDSDAASGEEWADMLDDEEQQYIMSQMAKNPRLLSSVPEKDEKINAKETKKRKRSRDKPKPNISPDSGAESESAGSDESDVEEQYEKKMAEQPIKKVKPLLPIKTKQGVVERMQEVEETESETEEEPMSTHSQPQQESEPESDSGVGEEEALPEGEGGVVSAVQLLAARRDTLNKEKLRIGALCSNLLESPEKKLKNLYPILYLMEENLKDGSINLHSVRKLATLSAFEVFKDILPDYQIRHQDYSNVKLKKETLTLYKYEKELLEFYKRYLQRLEKATNVLRLKKGDHRRIDEASFSLALVSLRCLCGLLTSRPQFNYCVNIAQTCVPLLGSRRQEARDVVGEACSQLFKEDNKGEITLNVVRLINQLVKKRGDRLPPSALDCLLSLRLRDIELDLEADVKHKQKQDERHKKRIVNLSKKEKKRNKKLKEVEKELLETQAQESDLARRKQMTEVTTTVFHIYFRVLKTAPHSKLLAAVLTGLAKFTPVINLELYSELVGILSRLISDSLVGRRERILCVRTALAVLAGAGDALNVDPARFHLYLYDNMLNVHTAANHEDTKIILEALLQVCSRIRKVSFAVLQAFAKRLATICLQLHHNGSLACMATLYQLAQQSKPVASLFENTEQSGSGRFDPQLASPEHCNAHAAGMHELALLTKHYHPTTRQTAALLLHQPSSLPKELVKLSPVQIFNQYDGSQLAFKPSIPPPKKTINAKRPAHTHVWSQHDLKDFCLSVEENVELTMESEMAPAKKSRKR